MSESFAELFEESLKTLNLQAGSIITAIIVDTNPTRATSQLWLKPGGSNKSVAVSVNLYPFTSRNPDGLTAYDLVSSMRA